MSILNQLNLSAQEEQLWRRTSFSLKSKLSFFKVIEYRKNNLYFYFDLPGFREHAYEQRLRYGDEIRVVKLFQKMEGEMEGDTLFINDYEKEALVSGLIYQYTYKAVRSGNLIIYDSKTGQREIQLIRKNFKYNCGPRCGRGGKRYFLRSTGQEIYDWIEYVK